MTPPTPTRILIRHVLIRNDAIFDRTRLTTTITPFRKQSLALTRLRRTTSTIARLCLGRNCLASRTILPPRSIRTNLIQLQMVRNFLRTVQIRKDSHLAGCIHRQITLTKATPMGRGDLRGRLQLLRTGSLFRGIRTKLHRNSARNNDVLAIQIDRTPTLDNDLNLSALSPHDIKRFHAKIVLHCRGLTKMNSHLLTSTCHDAANNSCTCSLDCRVPLGPHGNALLLHLTPGGCHVASPDLPRFSLNLDNSTSACRILIHRPLVHAPSRRFTLSTKFHCHRKSALLLKFVAPPAIADIFDFNRSCIHHSTDKI